MFQQFLRLRYTRRNSTCSLIEFKTTAGSIGDRFEELTRLTFQNRSCDQFLIGNVGPVESFLSKHAAALKCSLVLVFKARDVQPMYTTITLNQRAMNGHVKFPLCTSISRTSSTFFVTRHVHICHQLVYFTIVSHIRN